MDIKPKTPPSFSSMIVKRRKFLIVIAAFCVLGSVFLRGSQAANTTPIGDLNGDKKVTIVDLSILLTNFGRTSSIGDFNGDKKVTIVDLSILLSNFGKTSTTTTPPPPPPNPTPTPPPPAPNPGTNDPTATTCNAFTVVGTDPIITKYKQSMCEDFNSGLGKFDAYEGGGGDTVINRKASMCSNGGGYLALKQNTAGDTCGGDMSPLEQQYGYWEFRMRAYSTGSKSGSKPHPVLILWGPGNNWPDGEMDFFETDIGDPAGGYLHCLGHPEDNCYTIPDNPVDYSQWHVYGFEWRADGGRGYIDGKLWWSTSDNGWSIKKPGHPTVQLDNFGSAPAAPGQMDVDWIHVYK